MSKSNSGTEKNRSLSPSQVFTYFQNQDFEQLIDQYQASLSPEEMFFFIPIIGEEFYYITDLAKAEIIFLKGKVQEITGIEPSKLQLKDLYDIIHPEDKEPMLAAVKLAFEFLFEHPDLPSFENTFYLDCRILLPDNTVKRILRRTTVFKRDEKGNITHTLGIWTNISAHKEAGPLRVSATGPLSHLFTEKFHNWQASSLVLTKRESEILQLVSAGKTSQEIAQQLNLSVHTVNTHRKNMLEKTKLKNTVELVLSHKN
ncbi:LuxR C-terminal-related transcriptional regulator [Rufibacter roseus]|uniref:LuxR C-terminal-related transcriptional regulator n=1 Tax=Rufibacter roseus TaxID=1567108 RepID=A0ABW2DGQ6_9BACT|nr:LuxR C-terminal-related transcriptional regulator [Rufibacter roseus]